jgi:DNA-binding GntR family transcriptional regulator
MQKIQSNDLSLQAYQLVREMILTNKLPEGEKIVQDKLALMLGISRTPLRTALQMLEGEYLVESVPRNGMYVKKYSSKEIIDLFECRIALEGTAFRLFTTKADENELEQLGSIFSPFAATAAIDELEYKSADIKFHAFVIDRCGNNYLKRLYDQGNIAMHIERIGLLRQPEETIAEHLAIISAAQNRNADEAERLARLHLIKTCDLIRQKILENNQS